MLHILMRVSGMSIKDKSNRTIRRNGNRKVTNSLKQLVLSLQHQI